MAKIYLPKDLPGKIAKLSPEAQKVAKRLVRAKIRHVLQAERAAKRGPTDATVTPIRRDAKPFDEMSPQEKKAFVAKLRSEMPKAPPMSKGEADALLEALAPKGKEPA